MGAKAEAKRAIKRLLKGKGANEPRTNEEWAEYCKRIVARQPVEPKKVVFSQFGGRGYACNPRAIAQELLDRNDGWDIVWFLRTGLDRESAQIPDGIRIAQGKKEQLRELETAGFWVNNIHFNTHIEAGLIKRPETVYINTFHGGLPIKCQGEDRPDFGKKMAKPSKKVRNHLVDCEMVDLLVCSNAVEERNVDEFFFHHGAKIRLGNPRSDVVVFGNPEMRAKVLAHYCLADDTRILLYAPTFRNSKKYSLEELYDIPYRELCDALSERDGRPWVYMARMHPNLAKHAPTLVPQGEGVIDATDYIDMQELIVAADAMVSDYSSCITEFMLSGKPAVMYAPDLEHYAETRGINYRIEDMPFPIVRERDGLVDAFVNFDEAEYGRRCQDFLRMIGHIGDGRAAERVADLMESIVALEKRASSGRFSWR